MRPTYLECPKCGKRALRVATRCPQCSHEFPPRPFEASQGAWESGRVWGLLAAAAGGLVVVAGGVALVTILLRWSSGSAADGPLDTSMAAATPADTGPASGREPEIDGAGAAGVRRFARTWVNVRSGRSPRADVVAALLPGDPVIADSLVRGWYRVRFEGQVIGYVSRSLVVEQPPATAP